MATFQDTSKSTMDNKQFDFCKEALKLLIPKPPKNERPPYILTQLETRRTARKVQEDVKRHSEELDSAQRALHLHKTKLKEKENDIKQRMQNSRLLRLAEEQQSSAERRSRRCSELIKHHEENLQKLREELDSLIVQQKQLKEEVEKKHTFGELMDKAVKAGRRFKDPQELIRHHHKRRQILQDLLTTLDERRKALAHLQHGSKFLKKKHSVKQVMNRTKLISLQDKLDDTKAEVLKLEAQWNEVQDLARMKERKLAEIHQGAYSVSRHLWRRESKFSKQDLGTTELLDKMTDFICDMKSILEEVKNESTVAGSHLVRKTKFDKKR